jgi:hypothetical protein
VLICIGRVIEREITTSFRLAYQPLRSCAFEKVRTSVVESHSERESEREKERWPYHDQLHNSNTLHPERGQCMSRETRSKHHRTRKEQRSLSSMTLPHPLNQHGRITAIHASLLGRACVLGLSGQSGRTRGTSGGGGKLVAGG